MVLYFKYLTELFRASTLVFDFLLQCTFTLTPTGNLTLPTAWTLKENLDTASVCVKGLKILCISIL